LQEQITAESQKFDSLHLKQFTIDLVKSGTSPQGVREPENRLRLFEVK
jgi:hypothetical protein